MNGTRTFKRKGQKTSRSITLSLSFKTVAEANEVARAVDRLKSYAATQNYTLSDLVGAALRSTADAASIGWRLPPHPQGKD